MLTKQEVLQKFDLLSGGTGGIDSWLTEDSPSEVFDTLAELDRRPLSSAQFNSLLTLCHEAPVSEAFFRYYWLNAPPHPYDVTRVPGYNDEWTNASLILSLEHLYWGLYRFYVDALLFFGSVRTAHQQLRNRSEGELRSFFRRHIVDPDALANRGPPMKLKPIARDNRYLISEMACKSFDAAAGSDSELAAALDAAYEDHSKRGGGLVTIRQLLDGSYVKLTYEDRLQQFLFSADDFLDEQIRSKDELHKKYQRVSATFKRARFAALKNTEYYLAMVGDLDVYVATSMRKREDFRRMADFCDAVFSDSRLQSLHLRYFDPTLSAASNHEDKGLIECLMVKCAKVLVYHAGETESYGKDAEAAMALSQGKPVIFHCDAEQRHRFYRDVHPLSRLIDFETGVAVGAMVTESESNVSDLLYRMFNNAMEYEIDQPRPGYLRLVERLTGSAVRLQTNDALLRETFWNHYHARR